MTVAATAEDLAALIHERGQIQVTLVGWEQRSVWGVKDGYLYATMWRNDEPGPGVEVEAGRPKLTNPLDLITWLSLLLRVPSGLLIFALQGIYANVPDESPPAGAERPAWQDTGMTVTLTDVTDLESMFNHS